MVTAGLATCGFSPSLRTMSAALGLGAYRAEIGVLGALVGVGGKSRRVRILLVRAVNRRTK